MNLEFHDDAKATFCNYLVEIFANEFVLKTLI